jgi:hypothetical protein
MFHTGITRTTSILLAILLVMAAVAPPAIRHTHPLADENQRHHNHDGNPDLSHDHCHYGDGRGHYLADRYAGAAELTNGHWWHLHFRFLDLEMTVPEPASDQGDGESDGKDTVSVLASAQPLLPCQALPSASAQQLILRSTFSAPSDAAPMHVVVWAPAPVSFAPLCDSARRERSGVLLV